MKGENLLINDVIEFINKKDKKGLREYLNDVHPTDIVELLENLSEGAGKRAFNALTPEKAVQVIEGLKYDLRLRILYSLPRNYMVKLLNEMSNDKMADFLGELPEELSNKLLEMLSKKGKLVVESLLEYDENIAGGLMTTEYVFFYPETSIKEVLEQLPDIAPDAETIYYIYVVNHKNEIKGVVSLRDLILAEPELPIKDVMLADVKTIDVWMDQEEVAKAFEKYGLLGMPVVDNDKKLLGIITVDDVFDVIEAEATEDILKLAGADFQIDIEESTAWSRAYKRLPWLLIALAGQIFSVQLMSGFSDALEAVIALSFFIPVLMDMGGNVGTQSSTIIVRGLATDNIDINKSIFENILREGTVGFLSGVLSGLVAALIAYIWQADTRLGFVVGISMTITLTVAAMIGAFVPLALNKIGKDPADSSGPLVTTVLDIVGLLVYFGFVSMFMSYLL